VAGNINRKQAVAEICAVQLARLGDADRHDLLLDWWGIDPADAEFWQLPAALRRSLETDDLPADSSKASNDPLLIIGLRAGLRGVTNSYLERLRAALGLPERAVVGKSNDCSRAPYADT
jgi:hypothetical protein